MNLDMHNKQMFSIVLCFGCLSIVTIRKLDQMFILPMSTTMQENKPEVFNPIALRKAKIIYNFAFLSAIGLSSYLYRNRKSRLLSNFTMTSTLQWQYNRAANCTYMNIFLSVSIFERLFLFSFISAVHFLTSFVCFLEC